MPLALYLAYLEIWRLHVTPMPAPTRRRRLPVTTPLPKGSGFVRNACVDNHYVSPNRLSPSPKIS